MTKEQALPVLENLKYELSNQVGSKYCRAKYEAINYVIEALKQETVSKEVYDNEHFARKEAEQKLWELQQNASDDCVSRQVTLDAIIKELGIRNESYLLECEKPIYNVVKNIPPVTPTQRWIPVSERLPEDRNLVLVTAYWHETYQVMMASYFGEGLWWCVPFNNCGDHMQKLNPKAWSPLPQPYEEKRGDAE